MYVTTPWQARCGIQLSCQSQLSVIQKHLLHLEKMPSNCCYCSINANLTSSSSYLQTPLLGLLLDLLLNDANLLTLRFFLLKTEHVMIEGELVSGQILTDDTEAESESGEEDGAEEGLIVPATQFGLKQLDLKLMLGQRKYEQVGILHQEENK